MFHQHQQHAYYWRIIHRCSTYISPAINNTWHHHYTPKYPIFHQLITYQVKMYYLWGNIEVGVNVSVATLHKRNVMWNTLFLCLTNFKTAALAWSYRAEWENHRSYWYQYTRTPEIETADLSQSHAGLNFRLIVN